MTYDGNVGTWLQLVHWGPIIALSVIFHISAVAANCCLMWWPVTSVGGAVNFIVFVTWISLTLYNYFQATWKGPGFVPLEWVPEDNQAKKCLQFCYACNGYKSPRSHHCRKCNRCVMKMDHHCPWINTCCGHLNHANFVWFLFFAPIGCIHAVIILIPSIYRALNFHYFYFYHRNEPLVQLGLVTFIVTMFGIGLAIGVVIAVGMLLYIQMKSICKNETGIESWIIDKAEDRIREDDEGEFVYPYNLGCRKNLKEVFTWSGKPLSDGFTWNVVDSCDQYTLTIEQIKQKGTKRERTVQYVIMEDYSGRIFPISKGLRIGCCIPCTDEPRISLKRGNKVWVTRWKRHWLYGTKVPTIKEKAENIGKSKPRFRGWFPRRCAKEMIDDNMNNKKAI